MHKTIKLEDKVHSELEELRLKKETYSQAVARLITFYKEIARVVWSHSAESPRIPGQ
jgi:predicted CopG family antitoxin